MLDTILCAIVYLIVFLKYTLMMPTCSLVSLQCEIDIDLSFIHCYKTRKQVLDIVYEFIILGMPSYKVCPKILKAGII